MLEFGRVAAEHSMHPAPSANWQAMSAASPCEIGENAGTSERLELARPLCCSRSLVAFYLPLHLVVHVSTRRRLGFGAVLSNSRIALCSARAFRSSEPRFGSDEQNTHSADAVSVPQPELQPAQPLRADRTAAPDVCWRSCAIAERGLAAAFRAVTSHFVCSNVPPCRRVRVIGKVERNPDQAFQRRGQRWRKIH